MIEGALSSIGVGVGDGEVVPEPESANSDVDVESSTASLHPDKPMMPEAPSRERKSRREGMSPGILNRN